MLNPFVEKLARCGQLSETEKQILGRVTATVSDVKPHTDLILEGDRPSTVHVLMAGFAYRYKILADGARQIVAYMVPGDLCNPHIFILKRMDHTIATLSACKVAELSAADILRMTDHHPGIARALWWSTLVDESISREWISNIGRRRAVERVAHLLCEMVLRLRIVGLVENDRFELPVTQVELADTVAVTNVHMNRVINSLRHLGLITLHGKNVTIIDLEKLQNLAGFTPDYLHLNGTLLRTLP